MSDAVRMYCLGICALLLLCVTAGPEVVAAWGLRSWLGYPVGLALFALLLVVVWLYCRAVLRLVPPLQVAPWTHGPADGASATKGNDRVRPLSLAEWISLGGATGLSIGFCAVCLLAVRGIGAVRLLPATRTTIALCVVVAFLPFTAAIWLVVAVAYQFVQQVVRRQIWRDPRP
jgi:hypothetical protein